ncbi:uncharacterized protein [Acropora muricata]|uniref:uncharacterized protein isoform X6 n=1 Tax=Acropora muricata TaxID=159855 RepID=UPI0034E3B7B1
MKDGANFKKKSSSQLAYPDFLTNCCVSVFSYVYDECLPNHSIRNAIFCVFYSHHDSPRPNQRIRNAIFCIFYSHHKGLKPNRRIRNDNIY